MHGAWKTCWIAAPVYAYGILSWSDNEKRNILLQLLKENTGEVMAEVLQIVRRLQEEAGHKKRIGTGTKKRNLPISLSKLFALTWTLLINRFSGKYISSKIYPGLKDNSAIPIPIFTIIYRTGTNQALICDSYFIINFSITIAGAE